MKQLKIESCANCIFYEQDYTDIDEIWDVCTYAGRISEHTEDASLFKSCPLPDVPKPVKPALWKKQTIDIEAVATCGNCLAIMLTRLDRYCPGCGAPIDWSEKEGNDNKEPKPNLEE